VRDIYLRVALTDERLAVVDCSNDEGEMLSQDDIFPMIRDLLTTRNLIR
jgi:hypothetical protein